MKTLSNQAIFIFLAIGLMALLYVLAPILTPFLLGALLAYLVNPLVKYLEKWHVPHLLSVISIFLMLFIGIAGLIALLYPRVVGQLKALATMLPQAINWAQNVGLPWLLQFVNINALKGSLPAALSKTGWLLSTFIQSSFAAIETMMTIVLTPIVTFYLLRDWDLILGNLKNLLPTRIAPTIKHVAKECDEVLGAFIRGQLLVMLCLAIIYSIGLTAVGLKLGLIIGLMGGLLSIVPYLGSLFVLISAVVAALIQIGTYQATILVMVVFLIGQILEGYVLVPYLIGERIGLHPVAVIFAVMTGGKLFGFFGVLLALPTAAVLMAILRFFRHRLLPADP